MAADALRVLFVSSEIPPWVKSGGLGDVTGALPRALRAVGVDVRVLVPGYAPLMHARGVGPQVGALRSPGGGMPGAAVLSLGEANGAPLYALDCPSLYGRTEGNAYQSGSGADWHDTHLRFGLLAQAAAAIAQMGLDDGFRPHVVHSNDWPGGLVPAYLRWAGTPGVASVIGIHNAAYQGIFPPSALPELAIPPDAFGVEGVEYYGNLSFLKAGVYYADRIVPVSPRYAREIQTPEYGHGMQGLFAARADVLSGIVNGIDTEAWNPALDPLIAARYNAGALDRKGLNKRALQERLRLATDESVPLLGVVSRFAHQKGVDLLIEIAERVIALPAQIAILGSGDRGEEEAVRSLATRHAGRIGAQIGFDEGLAHLIEAGADIFLMPSRFEPCGLNQMYSLRYGTPPVVRATGGLADTVVDATPGSLDNGTATGFTFIEARSGPFFSAIERAVALWADRPAWRRLQVNGMAQDFSWEASARRYRDLYAEALASRQ